MARSLLAPLLLVLAILFLACSAMVGVSAAEATLTESDFKKMKIKEIRQFLDDRGLSCPDCQEKGDFVKFAGKNAHIAILSSKVKVPLPAGPLWEVWADLAKAQCLEAAEKKGIEDKTRDKMCKAIATATDSLFMQHGKRTAAKLKKKPDALKKTSWGEPYQPAGKKMFNTLFNHCFEQKNQAKCSSSSKVGPLMEDQKKIKGVDFVGYLTNVGIENTNPMYGILGAKGMDHDEL